MILGLLGWLFIFSSGIFASGAWYQTPQQIISSQKAGFTPRFVLLKAGVFSKSGHLSLPKEFHGTSLKTHCSNPQAHKPPPKGWGARRSAPSTPWRSKNWGKK